MIYGKKKWHIFKEPYFMELVNERKDFLRHYPGYICLFTPPPWISCFILFPCIVSRDFHHPTFNLQMMAYHFIGTVEAKWKFVTY